MYNERIPKMSNFKNGETTSKCYLSKSTVLSPARMEISRVVETLNRSAVTEHSRWFSFPFGETAHRSAVTEKHVDAVHVGIAIECITHCFAVDSTSFYPIGTARTAKERSLHCGLNHSSKLLLRQTTVVCCSSECGPLRQNTR